jgi:hypothetical protein
MGRAVVHAVAEKLGNAIARPVLPYSSIDADEPFRGQQLIPPFRRTSEMPLI